MIEKDPLNVQRFECIEEPFCHLKDMWTVRCISGYGWNALRFTIDVLASNFQCDNVPHQQRLTTTSASLSMRPCWLFSIQSAKLMLCVYGRKCLVISYGLCEGTSCERRQAACLWKIRPSIIPAFTPRHLLARRLLCTFLWKEYAILPCFSSEQPTRLCRRGRVK